MYVHRYLQPPSHTNRIHITHQSLLARLNTSESPKRSLSWLRNSNRINHRTAATVAETANVVAAVVVVVAGAAEVGDVVATTYEALYT